MKLTAKRKVGLATQVLALLLLLTACLLEDFSPQVVVYNVAIEPDTAVGVVGEYVDVTLSAQYGLSRDRPNQHQQFTLKLGVCVVSGVDEECPVDSGVNENIILPSGLMLASESSGALYESLNTGSENRRLEHSFRLTADRKGSHLLKPFGIINGGESTVLSDQLVLMFE